MQIGNYKVMGDGRLCASAEGSVKLLKAVCNNPLSALRFCPCLCWTDSELSTRKVGLVDTRPSAGAALGYNLVIDEKLLQRTKIFMRRPGESALTVGSIPTRRFKF